MGVGKAKDPRMTLRTRDGFTQTTILHELGHVIGFGHEHQRDDRGKYITDLNRNDSQLKEATRRDGKKEKCERKRGRFFNRHGGYDFASVMHYGIGQYIVNRPNILLKRYRFDSNSTDGMGYTEADGSFAYNAPALVLGNVSNILNQIDSNIEHEVDNSHYYNIAYPLFSTEYITNYPTALALMIEYGGIVTNNDENVSYDPNSYDRYRSDVHQIASGENYNGEEDSQAKVFQENDQLIYQYIKSRTDNNAKDNYRLEYFYDAPVISNASVPWPNFLSQGDIDSMNHFYD